MVDFNNCFTFTKTINPFYDNNNPNHKRKVKPIRAHR